MGESANGENQHRGVKHQFEDIREKVIDSANRSCTDILCCLLFCINLVMLVYMSIYAYSNAQTQNIYRATDQNKDICGQIGSNTQLFPYSYFYNPLTADLSNRLCVSSCPSFDSSGNLTPLQCYILAAQPSCSYSDTINSSGQYSSGHVPLKNKTIIGYDSNVVLDRICLPKLVVFQNAFNTSVDLFSSGIKESGIANFITDLQNNYKQLLVALTVSFLIAFIFMFMMRCFAGLIVWVSLIGLFLVTMALGFVFLYNAGILTSTGFFGQLGIPSLPQNPYYNIFGYATFALTGILLLIIICCFSRIKLAVAICNVAGQFISRVCQIMLLPFLMTFILCLMWVGGVIAMIGLIGCANFQVKSNTDIFTSISSATDKFLVMLYFFIFGILWANAFIQAFSSFVIAAACGQWYYQHGPAASLNSPVSKGFWWALRYHFGSLAFGSLIVAIIQVLQGIMEVFKSHIESLGASDNICLQCLVRCIGCCLDCCLRVIQFLNRTAYIIMALRGTSFITSSQAAYEIIISNGMRYTIVSGVGDIIMFIGKLFIAGLTTFLFYLVITFKPEYQNNVQEPIYLLILLFIASYAVAAVFMGVYSLAMDTILACFIIDEKNHENRPINAPIELIELMECQREDND